MNTQSPKIARVENSTVNSILLRRNVRHFTAFVERAAETPRSNGEKDSTVGTKTAMASVA
jgi:hypothetical protein